MDLLLRVAPEVRLQSSASGLRAMLAPRAGDGASRARVRMGTGIGAREAAESRPGPGSSASGPPTVGELEERARAAQQSGDLYALRAIEEALGSLHVETHAPRRRPEPPEPPVISGKERTDLQRKAFRAALPQISLFKRAARAKAKAIAETEADGFSRTVEVAHSVIAQHRAAVLDDEWNELAGHDRCAVIAELDADFAAAGSGATCIDAGWESDTGRGYVTVVARYPGLDIVGERGPGVSSSGRRMLRRRTQSERNAIYLGGLASFALATARRVIAVAVASDDVQLVVVRQAATGHGLEPIYVGCLSREAVTLRPVLADPVPLLLGSAARPMQFDGPSHDLVAVAPDPDVMDIVRLCAEALADEEVDELLEAGGT
ncbi:hypothetical protein ACFQU3_11575 [Terrabacter sp. GCM10028922]|uniref:hypothetical protein n=1 Tax=Terrabacter sp. GCM10028922 TaxID=3273428 RepID=UPI003621F1D8